MKPVASLKLSRFQPRGTFTMKSLALLCAVAILCSGAYAAPVRAVKSGTDGSWDEWTVYLTTEFVPNGYALCGLIGQFEAFDGGTFMCNGTLDSTKANRTTNSLYGLYPHQFTMNFVSVMDFAVSSSTPSVIEGWWETWEQEACPRAIEPDPSFEPLPRNILCIFWITAGKTFQFDGLVNRLQLGVPDTNQTLPLSFTPEPASLSLLSLAGVALLRRRKA